MAIEMIHVQTQQLQIQNQYDPMYKQYQQQQQTLAEQNALQKSEPVRVFYNAIEKVLGSRLMSAMSLASGMITRQETRGEKNAAIFGKVASVILETVPIIGAVAGTVIDAAETLYGLYKDKTQENKYQNTLDSIIHLEDAGTLAEFVARRLAQCYQDHITKSYLSRAETEAAGENAANIVYGCIKAGELKQFEDKSLDDKIHYLIKAVQTKAAQ